MWHHKFGISYKSCTFTCTTMSSLQPRPPYFPKPSSAPVSSRQQTPLGAAGAAVVLAAKSSMNFPKQDLSDFLPSSSKHRSLRRSTRPWEAHMMQAAPIVVPHTTQNIIETDKVDIGDVAKQRKWPPVDDSFVPVGPFPIPSKIAVAISNMVEKLDITVTDQTESSCEIGGDKVPLEADKPFLFPKPDRKLNFQRDLINTLSIESELALLQKYESSRSILQTLKSLFRLAKQQPEVLQDAEDTTLIELKRILLGKSMGSFLSSTNLAAHSSRTSRPKEITFDDAKIDKQLNELDIKHRRLSQKSKRYIPKPKMDYLDTLIDHIPEVRHVSDATVVRMMDAERSKIDMRHGDLGHFMTTLNNEQLRRKGIETSKFRAKGELFHDRSIYSSSVLVSATSEEKDWLYSDLLVYALDNTSPNPNLDDFLKLILNSVSKNRRQFATALNFIALLHMNLRCPQSVHEQFWRNHGDYSESNMSAVLARLSILHRAQ